MSRNFEESDWKVFRQLQTIALDRFCKRTLEEISTILSDGSRTHHERYLKIFRVLRDRDDQLARAFDNPRRSQMIPQLLAIYTYGLVEPPELERFSPMTRETIYALSEGFKS